MLPPERHKTTRNLLSPWFRRRCALSVRLAGQPGKLSACGRHASCTKHAFTRESICWWCSSQLPDMGYQTWRGGRQSRMLTPAETILTTCGTHFVYTRLLWAYWLTATLTFWAFFRSTRHAQQGKASRLPQQRLLRVRLLLRAAVPWWWCVK